MTENVAPNVSTSPFGKGKDENQDVSTMKPSQKEQLQSSEGQTKKTETEGQQFEQQQGFEQESNQGAEQEGDKSTLQKIKDFTYETVDQIRQGAAEKWEQLQEDEDVGPYVQKSQEGAVDLKNKMQAGKDKAVETKDSTVEGAKEKLGEMKEGEQENEVFEWIGENYSNLKSKLVEGMEECGLRIKSLTEEASSNIKHILYGPDAFEVVANQEKFIDALNHGEMHKISIPKRSEHYRTKFVSKGNALCWEFTVESGDVEFCLKQRIKIEENQFAQQTLCDKYKFQAGKKIQGVWEMEEDCTAVLLWDNSHSVSSPAEVDFRMKVVNLNK